MWTRSSATLRNGGTPFQRDVGPVDDRLFQDGLSSRRLDPDAGEREQEKNARGQTTEARTMFMFHGVCYGFGCAAPQSGSNPGPSRQIGVAGEKDNPSGRLMRGGLLWRRSSDAGS